jgi:hypothetical protein
MTLLPAIDRNGCRVVAGDRVTSVCTGPSYSGRVISIDGVLLRIRVERVDVGYRGEGMMLTSEASEWEVMR